MTKEQKRRYSEPELLKDILERLLKNKKFTLSCGHHVSFGSHLGNNIVIINGKEFQIICSQCAY
jgi:hypothetical protein